MNQPRAQRGEWLTRYALPGSGTNCNGHGSIASAGKIRSILSRMAARSAAEATGGGGRSQSCGGHQLLRSGAPDALGAATLSATRQPGTRR